MEIKDYTWSPEMDYDWEGVGKLSLLEREAIGLRKIYGNRRIRPAPRKPNQQEAE